MLAAALGLLCAGAVVATPRPAHAQDVDIEVPVLILEQSGTGPSDTSDLDLANIVQTAAKGVTTVQEAPAIVTVITSDDIRDRGWTSIEDAIDSVPGYMKLGAIYNQFPFPLTRGTVQAVMFMVNGISMFDPMLNVPTISRVQPIETIKRIELITGPGGVLWGANSYLGIANAITKDASDVNGVEADVGAGDGNGDRGYYRGYVMAGVPDILGDDTGLFIHSSFETFVGPGYQLPVHMFSMPLPNPTSYALYGPLVTSDQARSFMFNLDGKLSLGKLDVYFSAPFVERHSPLGFPGYVTQRHMVGDDMCAGADPTAINDNCFDPLKKARDNRLDFFDRYAVAEYQTRLAGGKAGISVKAYAVQFVRNLAHLGILAPVPGILEGGLAFRADPTNYRAGGLFDGDVELPGDARLLYGFEAFREWLPDNIKRSRQGAGVEATFFGPYNLGALPFVCPQQLVNDGTGVNTPQYISGCPLTFAFATSRTVLGGYVNPQWRITDKLTLDGGARVNIAPTSLGDVGYGAEPLFQGGFVYGIAKNWHLKANYTEGFRPPVFNNLVSNGEAVEIDGSPDLKNERSQSGQVELNARLFKGERRVRELNFRADYSYTRLQNLIQITQGRYANTADRGIHEAEFLGKLFIEGGHHIELGYTWMIINTADKGRFRAMPENWFNLTGIFALSDSLTASTNLRVIGSHEDANRLVEWRTLSYDENGRVVNSLDPMSTSPGLLVQPNDMVLDRLPASADLTVGLSYTGIKRLTLRAFAYNAFNGRYYQPDVFFDYEPRLEYVPNPAKDFSFQVHATYHY